jgi:hypothetical protein
MSQTQVRLGQEAFVIVTTDGGVERTMVGAIGPYGYEFLNGCAVAEATGSTLMKRSMML